MEALVEGDLDKDKEIDLVSRRRLLLTRIYYYLAMDVMAQENQEAARYLAGRLGELMSRELTLVGGKVRLL